jgi:hypothetical protein
MQPDRQVQRILGERHPVVQAGRCPVGLGSRPACAGLFVAGPLYRLQRSRRRRTSGLSRTSVVLRRGSEGQSLAGAVEEVWSGARSGARLWPGRTVSSRVSRSAEAVCDLPREWRRVCWHWSGCHGLWQRPRGVHCQAFEILDGGGEQELVPGAAEAAQSEAHQREHMLGLAKQGFDLLPFDA